MSFFQKAFVSNLPFQTGIKFRERTVNSSTSMRKLQEFGMDWSSGTER